MDNEQPWLAGGFDDDDDHSVEHGIEDIKCARFTSFENRDSLRHILSYNKPTSGNIMLPLTMTISMMTIIIDLEIQLTSGRQRLEWIQQRLCD